MTKEEERRRVYRTLTTLSSRLKSQKPLSRRGPHGDYMVQNSYNPLCGRMLSPEVSEAAL